MSNASPSPQRPTMSPLPPSVLFVTGTDTGVGKTRVSRGILRALARAGTPVFPLKLVETGCDLHDDALAPSDGIALARAAGRVDDLDRVAPVRFALPAAPSTAARHAGAMLDFGTLVAHVVRAGELAPHVLLEGAGGLLVPLTERETFADLAVRVNARVIVVARDALGTINHTLLTVEAATRRGLAVAAVVLNAAGPEPCALEHARELRPHLGHVPVYGPLEWAPDASDDACADALAGVGLDASVLVAP